MSDATEPDPVRVELSATVAADDALTPTILRHGDVEVLGRMPWSSNGTFLVRVDHHDGDHLNAIYKPERFERPLWDYPTGLWRREVATYELSAALGWDLVPPTVVREDAPLGEGSLQCYVPSDPEEHYFTLRDRPEHVAALRRMCVLDLVANNCDRKAGHVLLGDDGRIWGIDHGLSFHSEFKLRTVIWDFAGECIDHDDREAVVRLLDDGLPARVADLLDPFEEAATLDRARAVVTTGVFPHDPTGRRIPWPMV